MWSAEAENKVLYIQTHGVTVASRPGLRRPCLEFPARHERRVRTAYQPASTGLELAPDQEA